MPFETEQDVLEATLANPDRAAGVIVSMSAEIVELRDRVERAEKALTDIRNELAYVADEDANDAVNAACRILAAYGRSDIPVAPTAQQEDSP